MYLRQNNFIKKLPGLSDAMTFNQRCTALTLQFLPFILLPYYILSCCPPFRHGESDKCWIRINTVREIQIN